MCEYCDLKNYEEDDKELRNEIFYADCEENETILSIVMGYNKFMKRWFLGSTNCDVQIYYCPFCGRKLED